MGMIEKYSYYQYIVHKQVPPIEEGYTYEILFEPNYPGYSENLESEEWYDTEEQARFAAHNRIDLLESGE